MKQQSKARVGLGTLALVAAGLSSVAVAAPASATQDTDCMRAGMNALKDAGVFSKVAKSGLPISTAVALGVRPRAGTDVTKLPDPLPLPVILADHRAGDHSLFIYPWC
jgi:hypothetical protein